MILAVQLVLGTLAAYAFARFEFRGRNIAFALVLVQLMVMPDILLVENYKTMATLGLVDTLLAIGLPYFASAFAIFLLRQTFMGIPKELDDAARVEGASAMQTLWRVYVPLARPVYTAFALVSVSFHWNNFLWPLIVTNSVERAAADGRAAGVLVGRPGHRLVDHHRGHADDVGAAADRLPAVPAAVRAELHARRHQMKLRHLEHAVVLRPRRRGQPAAHRRRRARDGRLRRAVPAGDRAGLPRPARRRPATSPAELAALLPGYQLFFGAAVDEFERRRRAPALRQPDRDAAAGAAGAAPCAALAGRRRRAQHAAHVHGADRARPAARRAARHDHAPRVLLRRAAHGAGASAARTACRSLRQGRSAARRTTVRLRRSRPRYTRRMRSCAATSISKPARPNMRRSPPRGCTTPGAACTATRRTTRPSACSIAPTARSRSPATSSS